MCYTVLNANFEGVLSISVLRNWATSCKKLADEFQKSTNILNSVETVAGKQYPK
jgi:hypothetical protein